MSHDDEYESIEAQSSGRSTGLSRRALLKQTAAAIAAAAGAGLAGREAAAQVTGSTPGGGSVPLKLPACALDYLDRKQYIHNMEIHAHLTPANAGFGDTWPMFARGPQRILFGGTGGIDITDPRKPAVVEGPRGGCLAYNRQLKKWVLIGGAQALITAPNPEFPRGKYHQEYAEKSIKGDGFRGIRTYDATNPLKPVLLQEFNTGRTGAGTHQNFYDGGKYAFLDCGWDDQLRMESTERPYSNGLMVVDVSDPSRVTEVSRWWVPGQRLGEEEEYKKYPFAGDQSAWTSAHGAPYVPVRIEDGGTIGYGGWGHFGFYVHDFTDIARPKVWGKTAHQLEGIGGIPYHSCHPIITDPAETRNQNLVIGVFESLEADCREGWHTSYVIDVKDKRNPKIIGLFPRPVPPKEAPYTDFCCARGRFSAHNIQSFMAPGVARYNVVALSYFNAGLRIYDLSNPREPQEVAYFVPARDGEMSNFNSWRRGTGEGVFVEWDRNLIWLSTHEGVYCLSTPLLGKPVLEPRKVTKWTMPHHNAGWDDQTPRSVYFGRPLSAMA